MSQVHKEQLTNVENALPNRQGLEVEIFGMEGIPEDVLKAHNTRVLQVFYEEQAERRAKSGNVAAGEQPQLKKIKFEGEEELKQRLKEWKLRKMGGFVEDVVAQNEMVNPAPVSQSPLQTVSHYIIMKMMLRSKEWASWSSASSGRLPSTGTAICAVSSRHATVNLIPHRSSRTTAATCLQ
jgi:hypothetical protein